MSRLREVREHYLVLLDACDDVSLCLFCKYAPWYGDSCESSELECLHTLDVVSEGSFEVWVGQQDCWGFRPDVSREDAVDICGIFLRGEFLNWNTVERI